MSEEQIFQLYKEGVKFIDVTDGDWQTLNLYNKLNSLTAEANKFPTSLSHQDKVNSFIKSISKERMTKFLTEFSGFHTRYYKSKWGKESAQFLFDHLSSIKTSENTKITVEKVQHTWDQFSIIARFEKIGNTIEDRVILSAHQDSVNQWNPWFGRSPGADDDGSGTTTILEAFQVLVESDFIPEKPIEFHFYSAEEGGLLGSQKVVSKYLKEGKKVFGVFHNDMTGYAPKGKTPVIGLSVEDTNRDLTAFLRVLSDGYSGIKWLNTKCGYACSDHASWTKGGFASAFTFESAFDDQR
jgi:leucyl aminopeptidase